MNIRSNLCAVGLLVGAGVYIAPADARDCFWVGSGPLCGTNLHCPKGYVSVRIRACVTGNQVECCEQMGFISQPQKKKTTAAERVPQPKGSETLKEKTTAAERVKQRKGAGSLKLPTSTAGEKESNRPVPTR